MDRTCHFSNILWFFRVFGMDTSIPQIRTVSLTSNHIADYTSLVSTEVKAEVTLYSYNRSCFYFKI